MFSCAPGQLLSFASDTCHNGLFLTKNPLNVIFNCKLFVRTIIDLRGLDGRFRSVEVDVTAVLWASHGLIVTLCLLLRFVAAEETIGGHGSRTAARTSLPHKPSQG